MTPARGPLQRWRAGLVAALLALVPAGAFAREAGIPAADTLAAAVLNASPRHGEYVDVPFAGTPLRTWVSYPERRDRAGVVVVIHEIYGLSDWIRAVADQLAADGFIAVAPDLITGLGPGGGGTDSVPTRDGVVALVRSLTPEARLARIEAVRAWARTIPAANGRVATLGFCWGGTASFAFAAASPPPAAAVVFYGASPDSARLREVAAPVLGHYGGDDARVNATVPAAEAALGRRFEARTYAGAGHGFLRQQGGRDGANRRASAAAWPRTIAFLKRHLR